MKNTVVDGISTWAKRSALRIPVNGIALNYEPISEAGKENAVYLFASDLIHGKNFLAKQKLWKAGVRIENDGKAQSALQNKRILEAGGIITDSYDKVRNFLKDDNFGIFENMVRKYRNAMPHMLDLPFPEETVIGKIHLIDEELSNNLWHALVLMGYEVLEYPLYSDGFFRTSISKPFQAIEMGSSDLVISSDTSLLQEAAGKGARTVFNFCLEPNDSLLCKALNALMIKPEHQPETDNKCS
jgi:hypothetical protein